jgi:predicted nucleic acid-binding protein
VSADWVVDASVGIKLFVNEELSDRADAVFAGLARIPPARLYVPDLFFIECTNILWKYVRRFGYPEDDARQNIADLISLPLHVISTAELAPPALELAMAHAITAHDAAYLALAEQLGLPMVTADRALVQRLKQTRADVLWLADWRQSA